MIYNTPMNGSMIANELGISRQAVSCSLRKSMNKLYKEVINKGWADKDKPFEVIIALMNVLGVNNGNVDDVAEFVKMFSSDIQESIKIDAIKTYNIRMCVKP